MVCSVNPLKYIIVDILCQLHVCIAQVQANKDTIYGHCLDLLLVEVLAQVTLLFRLLVHKLIKYKYARYIKNHIGAKFVMKSLHQFNSLGHIWASGSSSVITGSSRSIATSLIWFYITLNHIATRVFNSLNAWLCGRIASCGNCIPIE